MTYAEYLKSQGASDDEIKVMDTAVGRRAFEKMQSDLAAASTERDTIKKNYTDYQGQVATWYEENDGKLKTMQNQVVASKAEAERFRGAILAAQEQGLIEIAENLGIKPADKPVVKTGNEPALPSGFDPSKFVTTDALEGVAERVGANLAALEDLVMEHKQLFPDIPLRVGALRAEAIAAKKPINQYWEEKYKVPAAREAAATAARNAEIAKWKLEGAKERETELASKYGDPNLRPLVPSTQPLFKKRDGDGLRAKQPWEHADSTLSNDRVVRATKHLVESTVTH